MVFVSKCGAGCRRRLTQPEAESADQAEQQQRPDLLQTLMEGAQPAALSQLLP